MARVDMGRGDGGQRRRKTAYGATRQACADELNKLLGRASSGELLTTSTPTVAAWLNDWYATHQDTWRPATRRIYKVAINQWIVPTLGTVRLERLKPASIQRWVNDSAGDRGRARTLIAHCVLRSALTWAMKQRQLTYNAAQLAKVPRPARKPIAPLTVEQGRALLAAAAEHRLGAMFIASLTMGLRIGEASGLSWGAIDLEKRTLSVRQQVQANGKGPLELVPLKTLHSRRTLTLPELVVAALKAHRKAQLQERLRAGATWDNALDLVFTTTSGGMLRPGVVRRVLASLLATAKIDRVRYHALRHTAATWLLTDGTPLFDVSRVLGHAKIGTTADIYGHLVPDITAGAAARMDALLKAGSK
jgi:integrase